MAEPTEGMRAVGQRIQAERRGRHLTQEQLGELVDRRQPSVARWEHGYLPEWPTMAVIARALGVRVSYLVEPLDDPDVPAPLSDADVMRRATELIARHAERS